MGGSWTNSYIPPGTKDGPSGETTPLIIQQAELGLGEALLSNDNRNKFFHHPRSGEGSDIPGVEKISGLVNPPNHGARGQRSHGVFARGMFPAQCEEESAHILITPRLALRKLKGLHKCYNSINYAYLFSNFLF